LVGGGESGRDGGVERLLGVEQPAMETSRHLMIAFGRRDLDRREHGHGGAEGRGVEPGKLQALAALSGGVGEVAGGHRLDSQGW
jgi:hypothetical protein